MRLQEFDDPKEKFVEIFSKFMPLAVEIIGLKSLPKIVFEKEIESSDQPTFGKYVNDEHILHVGLANRHPNDILRTLAHELVHYKQDTEHQLDDESGNTGSPAENEANAIAGVVMRHFNKMYPEYLKSKPIIAESAGDQGDIPTGPGEQLIPFPQGTTMVDVSDVYDWYKLGMVISDLDDADPKMFGQGAPHTVIAFGSEEEEHKLLPLLKRLGLRVHDIDRPEDVKQAIPAKMSAKDLAETIRKVGSQYRLVSKSGKNLGTYPSKSGAEKRERQVQYFKHMGERLNRTGSNELVIFDIDDTLFHTTAMINVIDKETGRVIQSLTNQQFNNYRLKPGENFDFGEFRNAQKFRDESVPIDPMLDQLKKDKKAGKEVRMLTARSNFDNQPVVYQKFIDHGIDINQDVYLKRAGEVPGNESPAIKKQIVVRDWLSGSKFNSVTMYDDSDKNLEAFKALQKEFPQIQFAAHHVSDEGTTRQVEERKKKKIRHAAYGPGPYGWYGYDANYSSGDGGIEETAINELNTAQTLKFIKQAHGDQLYGNLPYWTHPRAVALTGRKIFGAKFNSNAVKTAFLHDVVEDTHISLDELSKLGFDPQVIEAVELLTKDKSLTYQQNIAKIINSRNPLAMMVKYADNYENYTGDKSSWASDKAASSQKKYLASLNMLGDKLGVTYHIDENFADGRNPQDKGDSARHGIRKGMTIAQLKKIRSSDSASPRKKQLAHWQINMRQGRKK
jgi:uncharacterized FlaG/YvyC family protein